MVGVSEGVEAAAAEPVTSAEMPADQWTVEPSPPPGRRWNRSVVVEGLVCLITAIGIAGLGAPLGLLWRAVAPRVELVQTEVGPDPLDPEPEGYVADEGWFIFIAIAAGILFAVLVWFVLRRYRGPAMLVALVAGSIGGSVLAAWLGHRVGLAAYERLVESAPAGTHIFRPARVRLSDVGLYFGFLPRVRGVVLLQALVAAALYTAFAGFSYSPSLRPEPLNRQPGEPVSWDSPAPQSPEAAPAPPAPDAAAQPLDAAWRARPEDG